jgi:hypothetical protein
MPPLFPLSNAISPDEIKENDRVARSMSLFPFTAQGLGTIPVGVLLTTNVASFTPNQNVKIVAFSTLIGIVSVGDPSASPRIAGLAWTFNQTADIIQGLPPLSLNEQLFGTVLLYNTKRKGTHKRCVNLHPYNIYLEKGNTIYLRVSRVSTLGSSDNFFYSSTLFLLPLYT